MKLYGLTGGVGAGKSTAAAILAEQGTPVIDTDDIAKEVVRPGQPGLKAVWQEFGSEFATPEGLNRSAMAALVFKDVSARRRLETILHPLIRQCWLDIAAGWRNRGEESGVVVIPLLFETGAEQEFESVICIACTPALQSAHLHSRGWTAEQAAGRLDAQWPMEQKMDRANFVVWNDASRAVLREQLGRVPPLKGRR